MFTDADGQIALQSVSKTGEVEGPQSLVAECQGRGPRRQGRVPRGVERLREVREALGLGLGGAGVEPPSLPVASRNCSSSGASSSSAPGGAISSS